MSTQLGTLIEAAAAKPTATLLGSLRILDAKVSPSEPERMVNAAICEALIERHELAEAIDAIIDDWEDTRTMGQIIAELLA